MADGKFLSMRQSADVLGIPYTTFRTLFLQGYLPFNRYRVSPRRYKFSRAEVEAYAAQLEPDCKLPLPEGAVISAVRVVAR